MSDSSSDASDYVDTSEEEEEETVSAEVPTSFATKGQGWSGRDTEEDD